MNRYSSLVTLRLLLLVLAVACGRVGCAENASSKVQQQQLPEVHGNKFHYFGFGSNMLGQRIHVQNPTAVRVGAALVEDYRLDFNDLGGVRWKGAVATIVPTKGAHVWGTLWEIGVENLADIDNQEGVHQSLYKPITVNVKLAGQENLLPARAYLMVDQPQSNLHELAPDAVPESRQPSKTYLKVMVVGAIESGIPNDYVDFLKRIRHNNRTAEGWEERLTQIKNFQ
ncbi:CG4306, partial [Drosophila busckii]